MAKNIIADSKRRLKATNLGRLQTLQREQTRWRRRATFAGNRLAGIAAEIEAIAEALAKQTVESEWTGNTKGGAQ